jgi:uncharacterized protein YjbJ (UPF0337 family)
LHFAPSGTIRERWALHQRREASIRQWIKIGSRGSAEQTKAAVKEAAGKVLGDKKLETEGKTDKAAGKVQNAVGGLKDAVRGK